MQQKSFHFEIMVARNRRCSTVLEILAYPEISMAGRCILEHDERKGGCVFQNANKKMTLFSNALLFSLRKRIMRSWMLIANNTLVTGGLSEIVP